MNKILQSNTTYRIVSVIIAIILWFVFLNQDNPYIEKTFTIPVKIINRDSLSEQGLFLKSELIETVDVKVKGRTKTINKITANDFKLQSDLSQIDKSGEHALYLGTPNLEVNGVKIIAMDPEIYTLSVGKTGNRELEVELELRGNVADEYEIIRIDQIPETIIIDGDEEDIKNVATAKAIIDIEGLKSSFSTKKEVQIFDSSGTEIPKFRNTFIVDTKIIMGKQVSFSPVVKGTPEKDFYFESIELIPKTILVTAESADLLEKLQRITTADINITGINSDTVFEITPVLPKGITLAEGYSNIKAKVFIGKVINKTITVESRNFILKGSNMDEFLYTVSPGQINVRIRGRESDLELFTADNFVISVNVSNMETSPISELPLFIEAPGNIDVLSNHKVSITIKRK
jgi:YbbR domain-containing protein